MLPSRTEGGDSSRSEEACNSLDQEEIGTQWKQFIYNTDFFYLNFAFRRFYWINTKIASGVNEYGIICVYLKDDMSNYDKRYRMRRLCMEVNLMLVETNGVTDGDRPD